MQLQIVPLVIVVAYLVGMLIVGFIVGKLNIKDSQDYMLAGRRMGLFMVAFSLSANNIGGGCTTGLAQKAFGDWGMSAVWYVLAASIAMIPLAYFAPKIRKTMAVTIPEVVGRRFGKGASTFTAVLSILSLFCLTSSQIAASGTVVATLTGIPLNVSLVIAGLVIILYTTFGGMIADQISDLVYHHPGGPGHRHPHRYQELRRLGRHLRRPARGAAEHQQDRLDAHYRLYLQLFLHLPGRPRDGLPV